MKKPINFVLSFVFMILLASAVSASVAVRYDFRSTDTGQPINHVDSLVYPCLNGACSNIDTASQLPGSGNSGSNSYANIIFPTQLMTQYGYAAYYFAHGFAPQEYAPTWHGTGQTQFTINFNKVSNCKSNVENVTVNNNNGAGSQITISADIISAFHDINQYVNYVLPDYRDEYYSSDVNATFTILNGSNSVVFNQTIPSNIFMDSSVELTSAAWTAVPGNYTAVVETRVTDDQCGSSIPYINSVRFYINRTYQCSDNADNDGDGLIDYPADPGCINATDDNESDNSYSLNVTLTAMPSSGQEPLTSLLNCSVSNGTGPFRYILYENDTSFLDIYSNSRSIQTQRTFSDGLYSITCFVTDNLGMNGSDNVMVNVTNITDLPECSDAIDNDGDLLIDYPADPGCINATDDNESDIPHVCENHLNITRVRMGSVWVDVAENGTYLAQNADIANGQIPFDAWFTNTGNITIDGDNYTTTMANQNTGEVGSETSVLDDILSNSTFLEGFNFNNFPVPLVNGTYNMTISAYGEDIFNCTQYDDFRFFLTVNISLNETYECSDAIDNDGDLLIDYPADPGCLNATDDNESDMIIPPECSDGIDNDGDGFIDYPADPGCINTTDDNESDHPAGNDPPVVTLLFPEDNSTFEIGNVVLIYGVVDDYTSLLDCTLYSNITGSFSPVQSQLTQNGAMGFFNVLGIPNGTYIWNVMCSDGSLSAFAPRNWTFTINSTGYVDIPAEVNITAVPDNGTEPLAVQFSSSVSGNSPIIYSWNFGDGHTSGDVNPQHTYQNDGVYTATLTITDADGDTASDSVIITVSDSGSGNDGTGDEEDKDTDVCDLYLGRIIIYSDLVDDMGEEYVAAGDELFVNVFFENNGDFNLYDIKFRAFIPDIAESDSSNFDLKIGDHTAKTVTLNIPKDTKPGDYDVQVYAYNDCVTRIKYRVATVLKADSTG